MASANITVEDSSPLISYAPNGAWTDTPSGDALAASYSGQSFHTTATQGATATIKFFGTGISIFGGRRPNYGSFTLAVDGNTTSNCDASTSSSPATQQMLCSSSGLSNGAHTAVLTNTENTSVDIDWIDFQTQLGSSVTFDDSDPGMTYSPPSAWNSNSSPNFMNNTLHYTQTPGASASFQFSGDAVAVYGTVSPDHANIDVTVDGQSTTLTGGSGGFVSGLRTQVLLYFGTNLGAGQHTIAVSGQTAAGTGPFVDIDAMRVYSVSASGGDSSGSGNSSSDDNISTVAFTSSTVAFTSSTVAFTSSTVAFTSSTVAFTSSTASSMSTSSATDRLPIQTTPSRSSQSSSSSSVVSKGTIIGASIGAACVFMLLLGLLLFLLWRRRQRRQPPSSRPRVTKSIIRSPVARTPQLPLQNDPNMLETGLLRPTFMENPAFPFPPPPPAVTVPSAARHSIAPSYYGNPAYADPPSKSHSRAPSTASSSSGAPLIRVVPNLSVPRPPAAGGARKPAPRLSSYVTTNANHPYGTPARPKRPPTVDLSTVPGSPSE